MAPPVALELDAPRRATVGDDVTVTVKLSARAPVDIADCTVRWISRWSRHTRVWTFLPAQMSPGFSGVSRQESETTVSSARLRQLCGPWPERRLTETSVRIETVDVAPSSVLLPGFGAVLNFVESEVRLNDGTQVSKRLKVWARPRFSDGATPESPAVTRVTGQPGVEIAGRDGGRVLFGEMYRPVEGTLRLQAGDSDADRGAVTLRLTCTAQWQVHYMVPVGSRTAAGGFMPRFRRDWREQTMEREVSQQSMTLGTVPTSALGAGRFVEMPFSFPGPKSSAQSTECPEGFVAWTVDATWTAGDHRSDASAPIVMSMPVVPRRQLPGGDRGWRRAWYRRGGDSPGPDAAAGDS